MVSRQMEEYLAVIAKLDERGEPVTTSTLAKERQVSPPSVTEMLHRLSERGLVAYEPRGDISLTPEGRRLASSLVRRHRLWERFLYDVLGLKWDRVHDEACRLEHATSSDVEVRLERLLRNSETCPHGHAIPGSAAEAGSQALVPLAQLEPNQTARVVSVPEQSAVLRRLGALGIRPGVLVRLEECPAEDDLLALSVAGTRREINRDIASSIAINRLDPSEVKIVAGASVDLSGLPAGEEGVVRELLGGRTFVARCLALGFTPGAEVRMVQNFGRGPVIVLVRDTRVALGQGEARKIRVVRKGAVHGEVD